MLLAHPFTCALRAALICLWLLSLPLTACAAKAKPAPVHVEQYGTLPSSGAVVVRSGLAWMDESSALFQTARQSLAPLLTQRGLSLSSAPPSVLEELPHTPLDKRAAASPPLGAQQKPDPSAGDSATAEAKAKEMAKAGTLPPLKLRKYQTPSQDSGLPDSVMKIKPLDPYMALFAMSQQEGQPLMRRGGPIPGRIPAELSGSDPARAAYALILRFSTVRPSPTRSIGLGGGTGPVRAGAVQGLSSLGYGAAAAPSASRPSYAGSDMDYVRGYGGSSPANRDFFNRDSDMLARDYTQKYGPAPEYASPPPKTGTPAGSGAAQPYPPGVRDLPGPSAVPPLPEQTPGKPPPAAARAVPGSGVIGFALEMECYDLAPAKEGKAPKLLWHAVVQQRADSPDLGAALPGMITRAMGAKDTPKKK